MEHLPPKIIVTATAGVGIERIRLLVDASSQEAEGLALLTSVMSSVSALDCLVRSTPPSMKAKDHRK